MSGGKKSREKGDRYERKLVEMHRELGIAAERVPLSGSLGGSFVGDVRIGPLCVECDPVTAEVKARQNGSGFRQLRKWLGKHGFLFLFQDRELPLVVMPWEMYESLIGNNKAHQQLVGDVERGTSEARGAHCVRYGDHDCRPPHRDPGAGAGNSERRGADSDNLP